MKCARKALAGTGSQLLLLFLLHRLLKSENCTCEDLGFFLYIVVGAVYVPHAGAMTDGTGKELSVISGSPEEFSLAEDRDHGLSSPGSWASLFSAEEESAGQPRHGHL